MNQQELFSERHPSIQSIMKWLTPPNPNLKGREARKVANYFEELAVDMLNLIETDSPEVTAGLRKLLEAKDCFVRAALEDNPVSYSDR